MRHGGQELSRPAAARYITDAENVFMETMEVEEAKQYCNAHAKCKGFTFAGPEEHPEDEARAPHLAISPRARGAPRGRGAQPLAPDLLRERRPPPPPRS